MANWIRTYIAEQSKYQREQKISHLREFFTPDNLMLDIGVWCKMPEPNPSENWLEKQHSQDVTIIAVGLENMSAFKKKYPNVLCVQADGCALPFKDNAVSVAHSNAVLEHVPAKCQPDFVREIARVASRKALLAVPDRFSPIEIHSRIFFIHWLPNWREIFRKLGKTFWASEEHLTCIFTFNSFKKMLGNSNVPGKWTIKRQTLYFLPVSLIAIFEKTSEP